MAVKGHNRRIMKITRQQSDSSVLQEVGSRIALHRLNRNLTQAQLAREAGVSLSTVNRMEAGNSVQIANLVRVLRVLGMLENVNLLVPQPAISPVQQLKLAGKTRKRARPAKAANVNKKPGGKQSWSWDSATQSKLADATVSESENE